MSGTCTAFHFRCSGFILSPETLITTSYLFLPEEHWDEMRSVGAMFSMVFLFVPYVLCHCLLQPYHCSCNRVWKVFLLSFQRYEISQEAPVWKKERMIKWSVLYMIVFSASGDILRTVCCIEMCKLISGICLYLWCFQPFILAVLNFIWSLQIL